MGKVSSNHFGTSYWMLFLYFSFNDIESEEESVLRKVFKPVVCLGRQPGCEVLVLGPNLLFKSDGNLIASDKQDYIVIPGIIQKLGLGGALSLIEVLPVVPNPLCTVLTGMKRIAGNNYMCAIFCLGM